MDKIKKISKFFKIFLIFMAFIFPLWETIFWAYVHHFPEWIASKHCLEIIGPAETTKIKRFLAWAINIPSSILWIYMMLILSKIFKNYETKNIFSIENSKYYEKLGIITLFFIIIAWIENISINILFFIRSTLLNNILEEFDLSYLVGLMISIIIIVIGYVMKEAHKISKEQSEII